MNNKQLIESLEHHLLEFAKDYNQIIQNIKASEVLTPQEKRIAIEKAMRAVKVAEKNRAYYQRNKEKLAVRSKAYREANRDQINARQSAQRQANREQYNAYMRDYYQNNRKDYYRSWREANREQYNAYMRDYRARQKKNQGNQNS